MIDYETFQQIRLLHDQKNLKASQIALELNLDPKTVQKWVNVRRYRPREQSKRTSKLDPFKNQIVALLERHPYSAQQVLQRLQEQGFDGRYGIVKEFVRKVRPVHKPAFLSLEFAAAECAQVDWGQWGSVQVGSTRRRLSFFVMVLCYSRLMYLEFTLSEAMDQFLTCHRRALEFFGGTPKRVMIDNLRVGVLRHPTGQPAQFNPRYLDFAAHYGFEPVACARGKGNEKGRVERGVGYVKDNLLEGLDIVSFEPMTPAGHQWLDIVANVRVHRETNRKPREMFEEEKHLLRPLPVMPYDCAVVESVSSSRCCLIAYDGNRYSVPHLYASQKLTLKAEPERLHIFHNEKLLATHVRSYDRRQRIKEPDHEKELIIQRKKARNQTLLLAFLNLTPKAELYCRRLQEKRLNSPHHIQKIVALSELYGRDKVALAIDDALNFEAFGCEYIANILQQREQLPITPSALHLTHHQDLLELEVPAPDLDIYERSPIQQTP